MSKKLFYIKLMHTIIWFFYVFVFFYILYTGIFNKINLYLWIAIGLEIIEGIILIIFKGKCPLTVLGYKYTDNPEVGFDIYLPKWLAKYNKIIYGSGLVIAMFIIIYRILQT
ncbi:hypothetical protein [Clostridium kluyveri]|uniref:DUF2784 domain-containing protein n=1 Tax=Clostridium kluyveri TaxID=1534 RepID=A0A1L5F785_CLOKL|nr:hypothetical protein [Clostridium kluyveri]APM38886.1 hypothetical protein BS101_09045 [Clostridium kluyveri]UZQ51203.1 hypothetical protein OP486_03235 [Clostridium kluyveri]